MVTLSPEEKIIQSHTKDLLFLLYTGSYFIGESTASMASHLRISQNAWLLSSNKDSHAAGIKTRMQLE